MVKHLIREGVQVVVGVLDRVDELGQFAIFAVDNLTREGGPKLESQVKACFEMPDRSLPL